MKNFEQFKTKLGDSLGKEGANVALMTFSLLKNVHLISTAFNSVLESDVGKSIVASITKSIGHVTPEFGELKRAHFDFEIDLLYDAYKKLTVDKRLDSEVALTLIDIAVNKNRG